MTVERNDPPPDTKGYTRLSFPDRGEEGLSRKLQRHQLRVSGQPTVRPHLLDGGLLRPVSPHGPGLPAHLRHRHDPRAADRDAPAGGLRSHHRDRSDDYGEAVHVLRSTGALPAQDSHDLLLPGADPHS